MIAIAIESKSEFRRQERSAPNVVVPKRKVRGATLTQQKPTEQNTMNVNQWQPLAQQYVENRTAAHILFNAAHRILCFVSVTIASQTGTSRSEQLPDHKIVINIAFCH